MREKSSQTSFSSLSRRSIRLNITLRGDRTIYLLQLAIGTFNTWHLTIIKIIFNSTLSFLRHQNTLKHNTVKNKVQFYSKMWLCVSLHARSFAILDGFMRIWTSLAGIKIASHLHNRRYRQCYMHVTKLQSYLLYNIICLISDECNIPCRVCKWIKFRLT